MLTRALFVVDLTQPAPWFLKRAKVRSLKQFFWSRKPSAPFGHWAARDDGSVKSLMGRILTKIAIAPLMALLALGTGATAATEVNDLYQAQTVVTGQGEANRAFGFALCLKDVLVKVSGDPRLMREARVESIAVQAGTFVRDFRYHDQLSGHPVRDEQGTRDRPYDLIVAFDPVKIDSLLRSLGREPWTEARPRLVVFLGVRNGSKAFMLNGNGSPSSQPLDPLSAAALQRDALMAAGLRRGIPIMLPDDAVLVAVGLTVETLPSADAKSLDAAVKTLGGDLALVGRMVFREKALHWTADWRLRARGKTFKWHDNSVTFDEAFRNAIGGAAQILSGNGQPTARR